MRQLVLAGFSALVCLGPAAAQQNDCQGDTRQEHHPGNFNFVTSSWVEDAGNRKRYVSCVANLDAGSDLLVHWFIPGPYKEYVPSNRAKPTHRLRDDLNPRPIQGCLQYGGLQETVFADFLGTAEDNDRNKMGDCEHQAAEYKEASAGVQGLPSEGYSDQVVVYFPSDVNKPRDTMLELTGQIGLSVDGDVYRSYFKYFVQRLEGRPDGKIENVRVEPRFPVGGDFFHPAFVKFNENGPVQLTEKGSIDFLVSGSRESNWRSVEAYYQFLDTESRVLAVVPIPLLQEVTK
ncbi:MULTISPECIES: hypothetical protein [unclassified Mesorhizobium]|uniref:hypothetical protein n=1 Tax=unclassified Mesorhizobium TaxID=325217 RepID=UPI00333D017F